MTLIFTVGHSIRSAEELITMLEHAGIRRLADVRTIPRSRRNPQYNQEVLAESLAKLGVEYRHVKSLGGLRKPRKDSPNQGWRNDGFRGYADYMQTQEFESALKGLVEWAAEVPTALMCAEALPWKCHRSLVADALVVRGLSVQHLMGKSKPVEHRLTPWAVAEGVRLTYPFTLQARE